LYAINIYVLYGQNISKIDTKVKINSHFINLGDSINNMNFIDLSCNKSIIFEEVYQREMVIFENDEIKIGSYINYTNTIDLIVIKSSLIKTRRGLCVGSSKQDVLNAYSIPTYISSEIIVYTPNQDKPFAETYNLTFFIRNDIVWMISMNITGP